MGSTTGSVGVIVADMNEEEYYWCSIVQADESVMCRQCGGDWYGCGCTRIHIDESGRIWGQSEEADEEEVLFTEKEFWIGLAVVCLTIITAVGWMLYIDSTL